MLCIGMCVCTVYCRIRELRRLSSRKTLPGLDDVTSMRIQKRNSLKGGNGLNMLEVQTNMGEAQAGRRNSIAKTDSNNTREPVRYVRFLFFVARKNILPVAHTYVSSYLSN